MGRLKKDEDRKSIPKCIALKPNHIEMLSVLQEKLGKSTISDVIRILIEDRYKSMDDGK